MHRVCIVIFLFLLFAISFPLVYADRGMISISPGISVYEPGQKAILAWNGQKEIMILSTDVNSSQETLVLEILPLPSRPEIEAASFQSFTEIQGLINEEGRNRFTFGYSLEQGDRSEGLEILFHTQIGAHNITVVKAKDGAELVGWASGFLSGSGVDKEISLGSYESVIDSYMKKGFRYYVLDLVTFSPEEKSLDAILYRFDSSFLYYPLLITSPVGGNGEITLFVMTKSKVDEDYWPMQKAVYTIYGAGGVPLTPTYPQPIEFMLSRGELSKIDLRIGEILPDGAWLTVFRYEGFLSFLTRDLMISEAALNPAINVEVTVPVALIILCFLLGAASALAGVATTVLITRPKKSTHPPSQQ